MCNYPSHRITPPEGRPTSNRDRDQGRQPGHTDEPVSRQAGT